MKDRSRNILVGLTMLLALGVCLYGVVLLGKFPGVGIRQYVVGVIASDAAGITGGSKVELNGVTVGQTRTPYLTRDAATGDVIVRIDLLIDGYVEIPSKTSVTLSRSSTGVGQSYVALHIDDPASPKLAQDGTGTLLAPNVPEAGLLPQSVVEDIHSVRSVVSDKFGPAADRLGAAAGDLAQVAHDLHTLLAYNTPEAIEKADPNDPNRPVENASTVVIRLDRTMKSLQDLLTDPKLQAQVREAVQNIADASAQLKSTLQKVDGSLGHVDATLGKADTAISAIGGAATQASGTLQSAQKDLGRVTDQLVSTLSQLDKSLHQITEGNGTTGKLVNDPRLYEGLLDLSKSLKQSADDLNFLLNKWKDEGVDLHLK